MSDGKVLLFNHEKCAGCRSCVVGCSLYHDGECGKVVSRVAVVRNERFGESFPVGCDACTDAPCAAVCPTGACAMDHESGITKINADKCIGCKECAVKEFSRFTRSQSHLRDVTVDGIGFGIEPLTRGSKE